MISTIIICILIFAVCAYTFIIYRKKLRNGCCGGDCSRCTSCKSFDKSEFPYKTTVYISGMTCRRCAARVEEAFAAHGMAANVNLTAHSAVVRSKQPCTDSELGSIVRSCGYKFLRSERDTD